MRFSVLLTIIATTQASAESFDRPIPQAQSATAEFWFGLACIALIGALAAIHWLVARR